MSWLVPLALPLVFLAAPVTATSTARAQANSSTISSWSARVVVDGARSPVTIADVSCPSTRFCAAVSGNGEVFTSTGPTGGASAWTAVHVDLSTNFLNAISCPSARLCVAIDGNDNVVVSTDPSGGASAWTTPFKISSARFIDAISCPSARLCVAVDQGGDVVTSTDPTGGGTQVDDIQRRQPR